ncbi:MAG: hypothetical protein ACETWG_01270 [Candidatus Neomarinimicrobiota bacterium]
MKLYPMARLLLILGLIIAFAVQNCGILDSDLNDDCAAPQDYPSKSCLLPPEDLHALQQTINTLNDGQLKSAQLDSFGYITSEGVYQGWSAEGLCPSQETLMITWAEEAVLKFGEFTGLPDFPAFEVQTSRGSRADSGECGGQPAEVYYNWLIRFHNQVYEGLEVLNTRISVGLYSEGAYWIEGHWYPEITIPKCESVSCSKAKEMIIGTEITWHGLGGEPHVFIVNVSSIMDSEEKVVLPFRTSDCIELRVAWRIGIEYLPSESPSWYIYVDTVTGETISIWQLFRT